MPELKGAPGLPPLRVLLGLQPLTTTAYPLRVLRGPLDQSQASGAAQRAHHKRLTEMTGSYVPKL